MKNHPTIIGFTGTRDGMTPAQVRIFVELLIQRCPAELHAGDCTGADEQAAHIAVALRIPVICHPPTDQKQRAHFKYYASHEPAAPYLERNHRIVDRTTFLIACPKEEHQILRSGTWATVRYALGFHRRVVLIFPNGATGQMGG
jgi:hypothetical protein